MERQPRSRGGFYSIDDDDIYDGMDSYWNTNADSLRHGNSDAHALRAADGQENSTRGNQFYGQYNGPSGTLGKFKGDVARSVFYMAVRYNGLSIVDGYPEGNVGQFGDLQTLLDWHQNDPPDDFEMNRNNVVYTWQFNRNPFIDEPDLIDYIWGNMVGEIWNSTMSTSENTFNDLAIFPNPTNGQVFVKGLTSDAQIKVFTVQGKQVLSTKMSVNNPKLDLPFSKGIYVLQITTKTSSVTKKVILN